MPNAAYFSAKAAECRSLRELATDRKMIEQLRMWIADFETEATRIRRRLNLNRRVRKENTGK